MQPSYALLPATSYPKTVGGMCYAITGLTLIGLKHSLVTSQSQARKARHAIQACTVHMHFITRPFLIFLWSILVMETLEAYLTLS